MLINQTRTSSSPQARKGPKTTINTSLIAYISRSTCRHVEVTNHVPTIAADCAVVSHRAGLLCRRLAVLVVVLVRSALGVARVCVSILVWWRGSLRGALLEGLDGFVC